MTRPIPSKFPVPSPCGQARIQSTFPFLLLLALPFIVFSRVLLPIPRLAATLVHGDFSDFFYPSYAFVIRSYWEGHFPLWNPHIYGGHPSFADLQFASFYPPLLLAGLLTGPQGFSPAVLEGLALLHLSLAGLSTYLFVGLHLPDRRAAFLAATVFVLGGYLTSFPLIQLGILHTAAWFPLILCFIERGHQGPSWNLILAGSVLAVAFLAGRPDTFLYMVYLIGAYILFRALSLRGQSRGSWIVRTTFLILLPAIGLSAIQWIPSLQLIPSTLRTSLPYLEAATGLHPREMAGIVVPFFGGNAALYVGMLPLALAVFSLYFGRDGWPVFWGAVGLLSLLLAFGGNSPLFAWLYPWAPGLNLFRQQERWLLVYNFAIAVLAGYAVQMLLTQPIPRRSSRSRLLWITLLGLAVGFVGLGRYISRDEGPGWWLYLLSLGFYLLGVLLLWGWMGAFTRGRLFYLGAWAHVFLNLIVFNSERALVPRREAFPLLQAVRFVQADPATPFRISSEGLLPGNGNAAMVYGLQDIVGSTALQLQTTERFWAEVEDEWKKWNLYGVKYALTKRYFQREGIILAHQENGLYLYRLTDPLPRAYLVATVWRASSWSEAVELINSPEFDFRTTAVLNSTANLAFPSHALDQGKVEVLAHAPGRLVLQTESSVRTLLVISERYDAGWRAWVDGREVELYQANLIFMGLSLEPGSHRVELRFDPPSFKIGLGISGLTLLGVVVIFWRHLRLNKLPPSDPHPRDY